MARNKRLFLLLVCFMAHCLSIHGQLENDIANLKGEVKSIEFSFFNFSDSRWEDDEIYRFNRNGDLIEKTVLRLSNTTETTVYKYNDQNNVYFESYSENGQEQRTYKYLYNKKDKLVSITSYNALPGIEPYVEITKCVYNNKGLRTKTEVLSDTGKRFYDVLYKYNTNDKIISADYKVYDSDYAHFEDATDRYYYDSKGNRSKHVKSFWCNIDTKYYTNGKLEKWVVEHMKKKECMYEDGRAINTFYYNNKEQLIKNEFVLEQLYGRKVPNGTSIITYDEIDHIGNWISKYDTHTNHETGKTMKQGLRKRKITYY